MPTYRITASHDRPSDHIVHTSLVIAANQVVALHWLLDNVDAFATASGIAIAEIPDVVDLTKAGEPKVVNAGETIAAIAEAARKARFQLNEDDTLNTAQVAALTGLSAADVHNRKQRGVFQSAGRGLVTKASVQAWLDKGGRDSERRVSAEIVKRMNEARAAKRAKATATGQNKPRKANAVKPEQQEDMVREEKLAKDLGMDLAELRMLKREGNVDGGYGWIDRVALVAYMKEQTNKESKQTQ